jgi:hypothetical protein
MFNLEQSIAEWRQQMLAAGIQTPVPLEELESHLREEIERQKKLGLSEQETFNSAAQKIGQARKVQMEFKKVKDGHTIRRAIIIVIAWLATGYALLDGVWSIEIHWNFFYYSPQQDLETLKDVCLILAAEAGIWLLAKASRDWASRSMALLVCLYLAGNGIFAILPAEQLYHNFMLGRDEPSPLWYRSSLTLLMCLPGIFWIWWARRQMIQKRNSMLGSQPIHSS